MKLRKTLIPKSVQSGFTLIEVIISIGILSIIVVLGLFISMDFFRSYAFRYEQDLVVSALQKARSRAMANVNQSVHGFCWDTNDYVIFEGSNSTCPASGDKIPRSKEISISSDIANNIIIFDQLKGSSGTTGSITVSGQGKTATITINSLGAIIY